MRRTIPLDGEAWRIRGHPGTDAAVAALGGAPAAESATAAARDADARAAGWLPARVPGSVLDDLERAREVPDLRFERNSRLAEWVAERAWTYQRELELPPLAHDERAWLRFDGIDHAGHVFLDGRFVARHEGMFVPLEVEIGEQLAGGGRHALAVVIEPAPESQPQVGRTSLVRVHKTRMSYGWDFCPRLIHQGLWQSVAVETAGPVRLTDVWIRAMLDDDLAAATLRVRATLDVDWSRAREPRVEAAVGGLEPARAATGVERGATQVELELRLDRPGLWWPAGMGEPALTEVTVRAVDDDELADERLVRIGIRRVELARNEGARRDARPWTFVVNGRPTEIRGWNWTPLDVCYGVPRPELLAHLLRLVVASHANLLRVWGGGLIETEAFFDACDRLGILVWQEFAQSSSGIDNAPAADDGFVAMMRREASAIVPLRRNHPSLVLWGGGNELTDDAGRPLDEARSPVLAALRDVVARLDPDRAWVPTSPSGPRFHNRIADIEADADGLEDVHGPWEHLGLDAHRELWDRGSSLFNSEFGVEGMANRRLHERLIAPEHRWPADRTNPVYRHLGDWWINAPLVERSFGGRLTDPEGLRRASQRLQADGLRDAIEANRSRWPRNSGSIPWQLRESYPNAWCTAVVDHRGDPKPAFFAAARAFAPTLVCARFGSPLLHGTDRLDAELVAWSRDGAVDDGLVRWRVVGLHGAVIATAAAPVDLRGGARAPSGSGIPVQVDVAAALGPIVFLDLSVLDRAGAERARNRYLFARGDDLSPLLDLPAARVDWSVGPADDRPDAWSLRLANVGEVAAVGLVLTDARPIETPGWAEPDDSGFDLLPGEFRTIAVDWADAPADGRRLRLEGWNVAAVELGR